jgi:phosphatidylglycerol---prolipoprotein diacylglyceryl transferase
MSPYLGTVFGYPIPVFAVTLDAGVLLGLALAAHLAARRGLSRTRFLDASLWALGAALTGARLGYALLHWRDFADSPLTVFAVWEGGLSLLGAITLGAPAAALAARAQRLPVGSVLDCASVGLALGQSVGRLGCVAAGCAAGVPLGGSPWWAVALPDAAGVVAPRFPSPLVEAAAEAVLCLALLKLFRRRAPLPPGAVACAYLALYGALRLVFEPLRGDGTFAGPVAVASLWSLGAIAVAAVSSLCLRRASVPPAPVRLGRGESLGRA